MSLEPAISVNSDTGYPGANATNVYPLLRYNGETHRYSGGTVASMSPRYMAVEDNDLLPTEKPAYPFGCEEFPLW